MITARFTPTRRDYALVGRYSFSHRATNWLLIVIGIAGCILGAALLDIEIVAGAIVYVVVFGGLIAINIDRSARKLARLASSSTLRFSDECVSIETTTTNSTLNWSHFTALRRTHDLRLLRTRVGGFLMVPERGFESTDDLNEFLSLAAAHLTHPASDAATQPNGSERAAAE